MIDGDDFLDEEPGDKDDPEGSDDKPSLWAFESPERKRRGGQSPTGSEEDSVGGGPEGSEGRDLSETPPSGERVTPPQGMPVQRSPGDPSMDVTQRNQATDDLPPEQSADPNRSSLDAGARSRYGQPIKPRKVRLDEFGMPLPPEASHSDAQRGAEDQPVAAPSSSEAPPRTTGAKPFTGDGDTPPHGFKPLPQAEPQTQQGRNRKKPRKRRSFGSFLRGAFRLTLIAAGLGLVVGFIGAVAAVIVYIQVINTVDFPAGPDRFDELKSRALAFETTRIYDEEGEVLYEINDPSGGRRTYVTLDEVSPWVIHATVATEDENFFTNPGFSIPAIVRAVYQAINEQEVVSGASTITQQLTRSVLLPPDERSEVTVRRKIKEIFISAELSRRFTKEEILELYLNQIYYGNLSYGIEAAAQTYFHKPARDLNVAEASFLAGIPQTPAVWDPVTNLGNPRDPEAPPGVLDRQESVVRLMIEAGGDGCVPIPDSGPLCFSRDDIDAHAEEFIAVQNTDFEPPSYDTRYPHWVIYVQQQLETIFDVESIYTSGYDVYTTLDPFLQDLAQEQVEQQLAAIAPEKNVGSAAVVGLDPRTGAIRAMIGSRDFESEEISGQINMAVVPRQPGSSIKPIVYLSAFQQGWTPATVIWDVPIEYPIPGFGIYAPVNYDGRFHGPQPVRSTLANSYNTPAVQTLDYATIPVFLQKAHDLGITSLGIVNINRATEAELEEAVPGIDPALATEIVGYRTLNGDFESVSDIQNVPGVDEAKYAEIRSYLRVQEYGLSVALGAGEIPPLEMASAFAAMGNGGIWHIPYAIERIELDGEVVFQHELSTGVQAIPVDDAYLISNILSDNEARTPAFGANSVLATPFTAAAKTGTTNDFRDNWTVGYHPNLAVAVWVGNPDNSQMVNISGVTGAGPIWRGVMEGALSRYPSTEFVRPPTIFEQTVCDDSGTLPSERCLGRTHTEIFSQANPPPDADMDMYRELVVDEFTGLIANEFCPDFAVRRSYVVVPDHAKVWLTTNPAGIAWAEARGIQPEEIRDPPEEECTADTAIPDIAITAPAEFEFLDGVVRIVGTADATDFSSYIVQVGEGTDPDLWILIQGDVDTPVHDGLLARWNTTGFEDGLYTIRVVVFDSEGNELARRLAVNVAQPDEPEEEEQEPPPPPPAEETAAPPTEEPTEEITEEPTEEATEAPTEEATQEPPPEASKEPPF